MRSTTLAGRIFAAFACTLAVVLSVTAILGEGRIREFHREEVLHRLRAVAGLMEGRARPVLTGETPSPEAQRDIRSIPLEPGLRLSLIEIGGTVLADSSADLPLENHAGRPEVVAALRDGEGIGLRVSATTGIHTLYLARRLRGEHGVLGVVRAAAHLERAETEIARLRNALLLGGGAVLLVGLGVSLLVSRWLARPLEEMEARAASLAGGDLDTRIQVEGPEEVHRLADTLNRMAADLRLRMASERAARAELETVLASMVEGVVAVDHDEMVLLMNRSASRLLQLPQPLATGARLWEAVRFPALEDLLRRALAGETPEPVDADSPRRDGHLLEISASALGGERGAVAMIRDVTSIRRLERMRMDFVASVSHELRTPLASVMGALETLEGLPDGEEGEARARFLALARRNASRLEAIVSDLLDLSSIEAEASTLETEPMPLARAARAAVQALRGKAEARGISLDLDPVPEGDLTVRAHPRRLEQCVLNLVENAIKYTPEGGRVTVRLVPGADEIALQVEDTGLGIPAAALPRVFERFYRVDKSRSREMGGTGLGLAIVKHVVRAHGGRVDVTSEEGAGSVFTVTLPRASTGGEAEGPAPTL